jgi:prepilin-type N-terminal cleavage/methylation domain-containing protein/prepilin-type processing-associated H-X9-DG protein
MFTRSTDRIHHAGKGFTLVELLVVIGILAVLIAMLMPTLKAARQHALITQCASNLRQLGMVSQMYAVDNKGRLPQFNLWGGGSPIFTTPYTWMWYQCYLPYLSPSPKEVDAVGGFDQVLLDLAVVGAPAIYKCPVQVNVFRGSVANPHRGWLLEFPYTDITYKSLPQSAVPAGSWLRDYAGYGASREVFPKKSTNPVSWGIVDAKINVRQPSEVCMFADSGLPYTEAEKQAEVAGQPLNDGYRHFTGKSNEGKNFVFFDGHVEYLRRSKGNTLVNKAGGVYPYSNVNSRFWMGNQLP